MIRTAILISGGGSNMVALARSMTGDHPARPCLVLSNRAGAGGLDKARTMGIEADVILHGDFDGRDDFDTALDARLRAAGADLVCLAGFMRILGAEFVDRWQGRLLNIHPSLLPKYTGLNTHARAIAAGDAEHGCSVHAVTAGLDEGPVLGQARVPVHLDDTPQTLAARVLEQEHILYPRVVREVAGRLA